MSASLNYEYPDKFVLLGGDGRMAHLIQEHLPYSWKNIDLNHFHDRRYVRRAVLAQVHPASHGVGAGIRATVLLNLPAHAYREALSTPGHRSALRNLLGISGCGQRHTLFIHHSSVHVPPSAVLDAVSGPSMGIHLMYGPQVRDLSRQTAVITVSEKKKKHHLYEIAHQWVFEALKLMGHGQIVVLSPASHDAIMANIQFLTHSFFLLAADVVRRSINSTSYNIEAVPKIISDILEISQRILSSDVHVYRGIAIENPANEALYKKWNKGLRSAAGSSLVEIFQKIMQCTRDISESHFMEHGISLKNQRLIRTPVSRVRDGIFDSIDDLSNADGSTQDVSALHASLAAYEKALGGDHAYAEWFGELQRFFADRFNNRSDEIIRTYG